LWLYHGQIRNSGKTIKRRMMYWKYDLADTYEVFTRQRKVPLREVVALLYPNDLSFLVLQRKGVGQTIKIWLKMFLEMETFLQEERVQ